MATQTATILVSDLVGSTELRAALGEDRAEEVRRLPLVPAGVPERRGDVALLGVVERGRGVGVRQQS